MNIVDQLFKYLDIVDQLFKYLDIVDQLFKYLNIVDQLFEYPNIIIGDNFSIRIQQNIFKYIQIFVTHCPEYTDGNISATVEWLHKA